MLYTHAELVEAVVLESTLDASRAIRQLGAVLLATLIGNAVVFSALQFAAACLPPRQVRCIQAKVWQSTLDL